MATKTANKYNTELVSVNDITMNENNPRFIRDEKLKKLTKSVKEFPEMLQIRPIVVNKDMMILGGNMRYRACVDAGLTEIPVIIANDLSDEQELEFLIKDNVSGGEWDWDSLSQQYDFEQLEDWGLDTIKNDWDDLDYIEEEQTNKALLDDKILITIPEPLLNDKDDIFEAVKQFLSENYEGCEVK